MIDGIWFVLLVIFKWDERWSWPSSICVEGVSSVVLEGHRLWTSGYIPDGYISSIIKTAVNNQHVGHRCLHSEFRGIVIDYGTIAVLSHVSIPKNT